MGGATHRLGCHFSAFDTSSNAESDPTSPHWREWSFCLAQVHQLLTLRVFGTRQMARSFSAGLEEA